MRNGTTFPNTVNHEIQVASSSVENTHTIYCIHFTVPQHCRNAAHLQVNTLKATVCGFSTAFGIFWVMSFCHLQIHFDW